MSANSTSNTTAFQEEFWGNETTRIAKITASVVVVVLAVGLNSLVIYPVCRYQNMRRKSINLFIVNMAISDILYVMFDNINNIEVLATRSWRWKFDRLFGVVTCKVFYFIGSMVLLVSPLSLLSITCERFRGVMSIVAPGLSARRRNFFLVLCWAIPVVLYGPILYFVNIVKFSGEVHCVSVGFLNVKGYFLGVAVVYLIVYLSVAILGLLILKKLRSVDTFADLPEAQRQTRMLRIRNAVRMVLCTLTTFVALTTPWHACNSIRLYQSAHIPYDVIYGLNYLVYLNSVFSPFIYFVFIKDFRTSIRVPRRCKRNTVAAMKLKDRETVMK